MAVTVFMLIFWLGFRRFDLDRDVWFPPRGFWNEMLIRELQSVYAFRRRQGETVVIIDN